MSDYTLSMYTVERNREIKGEKGKEKEKGDDYAAVEVFARMKNPSSYRFRSRALCNFSFPKGIERPFPDSLAEEEEEVGGEVEDIDMGESATDVQEDLDAQELVAAEEATIPDPEGDEDGEEEIEDEEEKEEEEDEELTEEAGLEEAVETEEAQEGGADEEKPVSVKKKRPIFVTTPLPAPESVPIPTSAPAKKKRPVFVVPPKPTEEDVVQEATEEVASEAAAEFEAEQQQEVTRVLTYQERIKKAMEKLASNKTNYLKLDALAQEGRLSQYSTKMDQMIRRIMVSRGSNLVYSQFKTVEGLGVLGLALKANGFVEIEVEGADGKSMRFSDATEASLRKGPEAKEKRFIFLTGEGLREKRNLILNIFNGNFDKIPEDMRRVLEESGYGDKKNMYGDLCWVFGITGAGAEGISLKCCRSVHIMEPYWNKVRLDQVKGRAIRICSHQDLPFKDREVEIYTYYTIFSAEQKNQNKIDVTIRQTDEDETSDEKVFNVGVKKDQINQEILDMLKETAVDCGLNAADNGPVSCFMVDGRPDQYLFDPNLEVDKILTSIELKEVKTEREETQAPEKALGKELGAKSTPKAEVEQVTVIKYKGVQYLLRTKRGSGGLTFEMFGMADDQFRTPLGEISINPGTGTFKGSVPVMRT